MENRKKLLHTQGTSLLQTKLLFINFYLEYGS